MIAGLPMYDWPEQRRATDAHWQKISRKLKAAGITAPDHLTRHLAEEDLWRNKALLLGQTCGYPLATFLRDAVQYVATPVYDVPGCDGPTYSSAIVVRADSAAERHQFAEMRFACNATTSLSGYRCMTEAIGRPEKTFCQLTLSGSHRRSASMVANGQADIAAIDAVCLYLLELFEPDTFVRLRVESWTPPYPALPMITARTTGQTTLATLQSVLQELPGDDGVFIRGYEVIDVADYTELARL